MDALRIEYIPHTSAGTAALDAANEALAEIHTEGLLSRIQLPGALEMFRGMLEPWAHQLIAQRAADIVVWIDQDPARAREALRPMLRRLTTALELTPDDVFGAPEPDGERAAVEA